MKRTTLTYNGFEYSAIEIEGNKIDNNVQDKNVIYTICDIEFWEDVLEKPCMNDDKQANDIDCEIFYYCEHGFCDSEPTEEEVIDYFKHLTF